MVGRIRARSSPPTRSVLGGVGGFAGLFTPSVGDPLIAAGCDGVGTKVLLGAAAGRLRGLGVDLVAMSVNDVLTTGARPAFFIDLITCGRVVPERIAELVEGVAEGCRVAGCVLLGGETAEHPDMMPPDEFDLAGFCVGHLGAPRAGLRCPRRSRAMRSSALPSSGPHSNGFSLDPPAARAGRAWPSTRHRRGSAERRSPTRCSSRPAIYAAAVGELRRTVDVRAMAHITGGGIPGT